MKKEDILNKLAAAVMDQDSDTAMGAYQEALNADVPPMEIINDALAVSLNKLGELFADEEIFLPELLFAASIVTDIMNSLAEKFSEGEAVMNKKGKVLLATVEGDVHDIGKSLVGMIMNAAGYEVIDAGKDVPNTKLIEMAKELKPDIVGLSALLTTTMMAQKEFIEMAKEEGIRDKIKIMVGGAPVSREWAVKIGADGWSEDASQAVIEADRLMLGA